METTDGIEIAANETLDFLTASQLVCLRKPDEDPARCVVGKKYYTRSHTWLERNAVECALESFKDTVNQKRAARICDLMQAEWNAELNASITSKLKGKFVQHMGHASNGKIALSPEESIFLLENGCIEISNGKAPISTEEAYKIMLKGNLSAEKYQVYSQLSQLGFIVVPHQTELGVTKYEKRINLDKHQTKRKRETVSEVCEEPANKRLTFSGAFSNEPELHVNSTNQETSSTSITASPITKIPVAESEITCHLDESISSVHSKVDDKIKESNVTEMKTEQTSEAVENSSNNVANSATINEIEEFKEASSSAVDMPVTNSNQEIAHKTLSIDTLNEINAPIYCNKYTENSKGIEVELETVEVGPNEEMCVQPEDADSQSCFDANSNPLPTNYGLEAASSLSKNSIDVMNIDSQNTEISCTSEVSRNNNASNSNINVTLEDSCSVMDAVGLVDDRDSNSDVMSCSSDNDEVLSVGVRSECSFSGNSQEDDEIKLLEVTKKEIKPLAVIDLLSDEELSSEYSDSDDDIQVVKVCNGVRPNNKPNSLESVFKKSYPCKKEERNSPVSTSNLRNNELPLNFPNCVRKGAVCVTRPPVKYLPPNVCPSKEVYIINFKSKLEQSQHPNRLWNSFRDMQDYQRARRQNRHADQSFPSFPSREPSRRVDGFSSRDARQNFNRRWIDSSENNRPNPWADNLSHRDARNSVNHRRTDPPETNPFLDPHPPRDMKQNFNHRTNSPEVFTNSQNSWLERNHSGPLRVEGPNFTHSRSMDSTEVYPNSHTFNNSTNPLSSARNLPPNPFRYAVPNAAAAINSVVSVSNQDMNVSMVGNHIVHPPLHSSSPLLPSFNANLPSLSAIGPMDIMAEVQRTAYTVATSMLSNMFGQNMNPLLVPRMPVFNAFPPPQNNLFSFPSQFNSVLNAQNNSSDQFSMQNRRPLREPIHRPHHINLFPCQYRNLRNTNSWNEVREAVGDQDSSPDDGSDVEEVPISPTDILWDPKNICPLVKPGTKYPTSEVLKKLQVSHMANLLSNSTSNKACFPTTCSIEITFDVYLPGTNYKKTCPDIPKHRIIVVRSTDPILKFSDIAFLQKKWNDGSTLQLAVVDNGDISYQSFNSICLPVLIPHAK